jgi:4-carboxymuconolactone decarboxylase
MKLLAATVMSLSLVASAAAQTTENEAGAASESGTPSAASSGDTQTVKITLSGSRPSSKAPAEHFTGSVRVDRLFQANDPSRASGAYVTFEPGARTAWHTHPLGQTLIVTAGSGRVQGWGGPIEDIRPGDVVWIPPGQKHWHGAAPATAMTHIAITEQLDGKSVDWLEKVSDAEYANLPAVHAGASPSAAAAPSVRGTNVQPTPAQQMMREVAPKMAELTDDVLFGDVWERPGLSKRDRSLVTVSALIAMYRPEQLRAHLARARKNGVTQDELIEAITHLAFYAGWPSAATAVSVAKEVFQRESQQ